jgi:hypothetical protein
MKNQWYVARFKDGKFIDRSPYAMSKSECDNILSLAQLTDKGFSYKVMHENDFKNTKSKK